ncbi:type I-E CRISPR-associated protein Cas6/Cse3/CasE [Corynebacterium pilosum]|uniref:CRISPR-associated protein n=1 Tax=Corynebacterium pilosum TaxID=35756 RepID=A0A376CLK7_9CORY|nr:type I-E CRISPR-associated protein Cas6/Cse3/CasE [Corynebacterium pilosum]STC69304.1 CRISPR-associated protein [Corynebacterium pilosum]
MTTFTKFVISPAKREGRKLITSPNALHARVAQAFPPQQDSDAGRVLWRLDKRQHEHVLYIVGPNKPELETLSDDAGWDGIPAQTADYDRFLDSLLKGQRWWFELVANPTQSKSRGEGKRGKVTAHVSVEHQLSWLRRKADLHGFSLPDGGLGEPRVLSRDFLDFGRSDPEKNNRRSRVKVATVRFGGELEIQDVAKFRDALRNGIGRAKGYGCGLMTLAPLGQRDG